MKDYIISIQSLLSNRNSDFDKAVNNNRVKLVRHKDNRSQIVIGDKIYKNFSLYNMYKYDRQTFLRYQGEQSKARFDNIDYIVSFLGENSQESRLIGVFKNNGLIDNKMSIDGHLLYDLTEAEGFEILKEKVIIDWGKSTISWHQNYSKNIKYVIRIEKGLEDVNGIPYFKSYSDINISFEQLQKIINSAADEWKTALQAINCIYMIIDKTNGKQYIGSTYTKDGGTWQRWSQYIETGGHGGNTTLEMLLKENGPSYAYNFHWIILETLSLNVTPQEAIARENLYKDKFLSREFGYNNN